MGKSILKYLRRKVLKFLLKQERIFYGHIVYYNGDTIWEMSESRGHKDEYSFIMLQADEIFIKE